MENLDGTILTTAAQASVSSLGVPSVAVSITITAYLLTLAVLIPLVDGSPGASDPVAFFLAAIAIFTLASVLCALSTEYRPNSRHHGVLRVSGGR
jgi:MFS family permease